MRKLSTEKLRQSLHLDLMDCVKIKPLRTTWDDERPFLIKPLNFLYLWDLLHRKLIPCNSVRDPSDRINYLLKLIWSA